MYIKYNRELRQMEEQYYSKRQLVEKIASELPPWMMDMDMNWRAKYLYNNVLRELNYGIRKIVWC